MYGQTVEVTSTVYHATPEQWIIRDRMNKRWTNRIDFLINKEMRIGKWENVLICREDN